MIKIKKKGGFWEHENRRKEEVLKDGRSTDMVEAKTKIKSEL